MDKNSVQEAVKKVRGISSKKKFNQTFDLIINLKNLNLKKEKVDYFMDLHFDRGRKMKICALVGPELLDQAKTECDNAISVDDFPDYAKDKKAVKKLANSYDFFIAQATIMPKVAATFGRVLGSRGKMPNPKAGCVVPPNVNLKPLIAKLQRTIKISAVKSPNIQIAVGKEDQKDEIIIDNILTIYNSLKSNLPNQENNIRKVNLKLTMGKIIEAQ